MEVFKPTKDQLQHARNQAIPDIIGPNLSILFCGINPGLYSAAIGHHFGRPGNRFWAALYGAGFTDRLLSPFEDTELLRWGYGITNIVNRASSTASELSDGELVEGGQRLLSKIREYSPRYLAVLGVGAYRKAFKYPNASIGYQTKMIEATALWVLPNPSGLNAHYQLDDFVRLFQELRTAVSNETSWKSR